jgi:hypothetical protein
MGATGIAEHPTPCGAIGCFGLSHVFAGRGPKRSLSCTPVRLAKLIVVGEADRRPSEGCAAAPTGRDHHRLLTLRGSARISLAVAELRRAGRQLFPRPPGRLATVAQPIGGKLDTAFHAGRRKRQIDRPYACGARRPSC